MTQALQEPVNVVSKYIRSSLVRPRPPGSPRRSHTISSSQLSKQASTVEAEELESDFEVFGPFPVPKSSGIKGKARAAFKEDRSVKVNDHENSTVLKQNAMQEASVSTSRAKKPLSTLGTTSDTSTAPHVESTKKTTRPRKAAPKLAKSTSTISTASIESEPQTDLPVYSYKDYSNPKPFVVYTQNVDEVDDLIGSLKSGPVALDMEWCFTISRTYKERRTAVVQVADSAGLYYIPEVLTFYHTCQGFPQALQALIENPNIPKLGANILNDGKKLFRDYGILAKNLVELGAVAAAWDPEHNIKRKIISLAKLAASYCGKTLLKGDERSSNWEVTVLSEQQKDSNDVHCTMEIYKRLSSLSAGAPAATGADVTWYTLKDKLEGQGLGAEMRFQWRRAHNLWHEKGMAVEKMCTEMK
ncbi:hypothetical protein H0H93_016937, partial [Arthromyces matolae]